MILKASSGSQPKQLEDHDLMPFGVHRGEKMEDVPASYLHYLWTTGKRENKVCPVADYIRRNLSALKMEYRDGIWD
jgi:hypothetical protein